jgi:myo-inositol-1(or 4)-monophosphatase
MTDTTTVTAPTPGTVQHERRLVEVAGRAAVAAGDYLRRQFAQVRTATRKGAAHDVVTVADARAEAMIREGLTAAVPGCTVIGEEGGRSGTGTVIFHVDPIDGTYNFVRGIPLFCVSIGVSVAGRDVGLRHNGYPACPVPHDGPPLVLCDLPTAGVAPVPAEYELLADLLALAADVRRIGSSALALAWVAIGRADVAANADAFPWDTAAGRALVRAAGGGYLDVPTQPRLDRPGGFVAWTDPHGPVADRITACLRHHPTLGSS